MTPGWWVIRGYLMAVGVAALIGLGVGVVWVIARLVDYYLLR
jgi:presenilin-like A22 family membrane protease